jgi:hypothetical protein
MNLLKQCAILATFALLGACATAPPPVTDWSAAATSNAGFTGAGANVNARSTAGGTTINVAFREASGMSGTARPWHVHFGSCGNDQGIVGDPNAYSPLRPGADGTATTSATIATPLDPGRSYFINIHKSPEELQTIVACGALTTTMTAQTSGMTETMSVK